MPTLAWPDIMEVHLFSVHNPQGEAKESDEMKPVWYPICDIPYASMWADDEYWVMPLCCNLLILARSLIHLAAHQLPQVLEGMSVEGVVNFSDETTILSRDLSFS
jgi:hypothetical protein